MNLRIPPVLQLAAFGLAAWAVAKLLPGLSFRLGMVGTIGVVALATIGAVILLASLRAFRKAETTVDPIHPEAATSLVTGGLYRYTRNPMYLGFVVCPRKSGPLFELVPASDMELRHGQEINA